MLRWELINFWQFSERCSDGHSSAVSDPWTIKINRAIELTQALENEIKNYMESGAARVETTWIPQQSLFELTLRIERNPPERWSAMVGDIVHNLRSALDARMFQLIASRAAGRREYEEAQGMKPSAFREWFVQFPIFPTRDQVAEIKRSSWHQGLLDPALQSHLDALEPYAHFDRLNLEDDVKQRNIDFHPLTTIQDLSNTDKHRAIHLLICAVDIVYAGVPEGLTLEYKGADPFPWGDGSVIMRAPIQGEGDPTRISFNHELAIAIERDVHPLRSTQITATLAGLTQRIVWTINYLRPDLDTYVPGGGSPLPEPYDAK